MTTKLISTGLQFDDATEQTTAVSGGASTFSGMDDTTVSTSDPADDTNPSSTGHLWLNKSSGEYFVCTDNTTDSNLWFNVGEGEGHITVPWTFQGEVTGFVSGGTGDVNVIQYFTLASTGNSFDYGDLTTGRRNCAGSVSPDHNYIAGGQSVNVIDRFSNTSSGNATDVGDLTVSRGQAGSASSETYGYISGGQSFSNVIDRYAHVSSGNATDWGDLVEGNAGGSGHSSSDYGWQSGGDVGGGDYDATDRIQKYSFSSLGNATDIANLTAYRYNMVGGASSATHGYTLGGAWGDVYVNTIQRFTFASTSNASDVGDLLGAQGYHSAVSGVTHGWVCGGYGWGNSEVIQRFAYASSGNATDWGDLVTDLSSGTVGTQY
jgi:hypothetical protein